MIEMGDFDATTAYEWALHQSMLAGCTCEDEPSVGLEFCDKHGVHLNVEHEDDCNVSRVERHRDRVHMAPMN